MINSLKNIGNKIKAYFDSLVWINHIIIFLITSFLLGKTINNSWLLSFTSFNNNDGIFWIIIGLLLIENIPFLKSIIKELVGDRLIEITNDQIFEVFSQRFLENRKFLEELNGKLRQIGTKPLSLKEIDTHTFDSGSTESDNKNNQIINLRKSL